MLSIRQEEEEEQLINSHLFHFSRTTRPHAFPSERQSPLIINRQQHKKWLDRSNHLASKLASKRFKALVGKRVPLLDKQDVQTEAFGESGDTESGEERIMLPF